MSDRRRMWPLIAASAIAIVFLCVLGTWQVQRLSWKNSLIATIDARLKENPISLSEALARRSRGETIDYLVVSASGQFMNAPEIRKLTTHARGPGFSILAPFLSSDGVVVLVDRGTIPEALADPASRPETLPGQVTGYLLKHDGGQGLFDGENNPDRNQWYWWDVPAMLGTVTIPPEAKVMDMILHRIPDQTEATPPIAPPAKSSLRNNHLGYAITWFGLAGALAAVAAAFVISRLKR
jgi:surfeit locus 1 family protein